MSAYVWYDPSIQPFTEGGLNTAAQFDDDAALDEWLASMTARQFEWVMNFLVDHVGGAHATANRPVA